MPDWSIQNYKTTPESNAAINGVDVSDATGLPGSLNDALRQVIAAHLLRALLRHPRLGLPDRRFLPGPERRGQTPARLHGRPRLGDVGGGAALRGEVLGGVTLRFRRPRSLAIE